MNDYTICIPLWDAKKPELKVALDGIIGSTDDFKLIMNSEKQSVAKNRNEILKSVTTPYIIWVDDDVKVIRKEWIDLLLAPLRNNPKLGAVSGFLIHWSGEAIPASYLFVEDPANKDGSQKSYVQAVNLPLTCCAVRNIGQFDENYKGSQFEDTDFIMQLEEKGYKFLVCLDCPVIHYGTNKQNQYAEFNKNYFYNKWKGNVWEIRKRDDGVSEIYKT